MAINNFTTRHPETLKELFDQMLLLGEDHCPFMEFVGYTLWECASSPSPWESLRTMAPLVLPPWHMFYQQQLYLLPLQLGFIIPAQQERSSTMDQSLMSQPDMYSILLRS